MEDKPAILLDINILLDVLQKREPFFAASAEVLALAETGQARAYVAAHSVTTLFYLIQKGRSPAAARGILASLLQFIQATPVDQEILEKALQLSFDDFEDAVQMVAAARAKMDFLITRNPKDFQPALLPVLQPAEFLALWRARTP